MMERSIPRDEVKAAIVQVGAGRGFVVGDDSERLIVTAAHCLPSFPPCASISYAEERTYKALLGPLQKRRSIWAECLFVDPIADIALLGAPDNQLLEKQARACEALLEASTPLEITNSDHPKTGWLLSLEKIWVPCDITYRNRSLSLHVADGIAAGMSGSPIVNDDGRAFGVLCTGGGAPVKRIPRASEILASY